MEATVSGKLVRDLVPTVITEQGLKPITRKAKQGEYGPKLCEKLVEEVGEFLLADSDEAVLEEFADIVEVVRAIAAFMGEDRVEEARLRKYSRLGGFADEVIWEGNLVPAKNT